MRLTYEYDSRNRYFEIAKGGIPEEVVTKQINSDKMNSQYISIIEALKFVGFAASNGEARRIIGNRGIKIDNVIIEDSNMQLDLATDKILQFGKSKFVKLVMRR